MNCETAQPLLEAFCDDELDVATAAGLLAHLEGCPACAARRADLEERGAALRLTRPADRCPSELRARLLGEVRRAVPDRTPGEGLRLRVAVAVTFAVAGLAVWGGLRALPGTGAGPGRALAEAPVVRQMSGEVFCLRCALRELFPGAAVADPKHLPVLRTDSGEIVTILDNELAERELAHAGCAGRRVSLLVRYYPSQELAEVLDVEAQEPVVRPAAENGALPGRSTTPVSTALR